MDSELRDFEEAERVTTPVVLGRMTPEGIRKAQEEKYGRSYTPHSNGPNSPSNKSEIVFNELEKIDLVRGLLEKCFNEKFTGMIVVEFYRGSLGLNVKKYKYEREILRRRGVDPLVVVEEAQGVPPHVADVVDTLLSTKDIKDEVEKKEKEEKGKTNV